MLRLEFYHSELIFVLTIHDLRARSNRTLDLPLLLPKSIGSREGEPKNPENSLDFSCRHRKYFALYSIIFVTVLDPADDDRVAYLKNPSSSDKTLQLKIL